jgi:hypothetical protein
LSSQAQAKGHAHAGNGSDTSIDAINCRLLSA